MLKIRSSKHNIFLFCLWFFILGVLLASFLEKFLLSGELILFIFLFLFFVLSFYFRKNKKLLILFFLLSFLVLGLWRYVLSVPIDNDKQIWHFNEKEIIGKGVIVDYPNGGTDSQQLKIGKIKIGNESVEGRLLVVVDPYTEFYYGDGVEFKCIPKKPENFNGFDYERYLARYDIYSVCFYPKIKFLSSGNRGVIYAFVFKIKDKVREIINRGTEEPGAGLLRAIILGEKKAISDDLRMIFSCTGLSHIIAISGMHISILSFLMLIVLIEFGINRKYAFVIVFFLLFFYILMVGAPASAVRAGFMGGMVGFAFIIGRIGRSINILSFTAFVLLMINPRLLRDDIGFQLSFLAIMGIVLFYPIIEYFFNRFKFIKYRPIQDILNITICAQILTWPMVAYYFGIFSVVSLASNLFVVWLLPVLIIFSMFAILLSWIMPFISLWLFFPVYILLEYIIFVAKFFNGFPFSCVNIFDINIFWLWFYYFLCFVVYLKIKRSRY